jgi:hypothetical protein
MKRDSKPGLLQLRAVQDSMVGDVRSSFSERELDALRVVIRLTVEFHRHLAANDVNNYVSESVFSGIDSFALLLHAYKVLKGAEVHSHLVWKASSAPALKREFQFRYSKFIAEQTFEKRCRLLLDLFKLQIVLAAMTYDCEDHKGSLTVKVKKSKRK